VDGTGKAVIHEVQFKDEQVDVEVENPKVFKFIKKF
jgi:hypothetical protein